MDSMEMSHRVTREHMREFLLHCHPQYELYYFLAGDVDYRVEGTQYALTPGGVLLLRAGCFHGYRVLSDKPYERFTIHFWPEALPEAAREELLKPFCQAVVWHPDAQYLQEMLMRMQDAGTLPEPARTSVREAQLAAILAEILLRSGGAPQGQEEAPSMGRRLVEYINLHLGEDVSLEALCQAFYLSRRQLYRVFREATGSSVVEYVRRKRLALAESMRRSGVCATEAAARAGYGDYSTYYRARRASGIQD